MLSVTSFEARIQVPAGKVVYRMKALSFDPCKEGIAITESTESPFMVQRKSDDKGTSEFSHTASAEMTGAFRKVISTESE